jgi:Terminase large subunit, T4likevirus-type, N-terminal
VTAPSLPQIPVLSDEELDRLSPGQQRKYLDLAREYARIARENPLSVWEPYGPKQAAFLNSREWIKAFFGGNGSGKSAVGTVDDLIQLCDRSVLPAHLAVFKRWEPPFFMRVVAPNDDVIESTVLEKFRALTPSSQLRGGGWDKAYSKELRKLHFKNGSWCLFNTNRQTRDAHSGVELHRVRFDEEPEWHIYLENVARLRSMAPSAQLSFTMTPSLKGSLGWVYDEIYERRDDPGVFVTTAHMFDNPFVDRGSMEAALAGASEAERAAMLNGEFISFHGRVLHLFQRETHVCEPPTVEHVRQLDVYVGIDPGIRRGGVVWVGFDRDNAALVFDELYPDSETVAQIAAQIRARNAYWGGSGPGSKPIQPIYVIDPSARNRTLTNAESFEGELQREGIFCVPGQNDRFAGISQMRGRVEKKSLIVSRECKNWLKEAERWVVAEDEVSSEDVKKGKVKGAGGSFATVGPDHLQDPTRYVLMERPWFQHLQTHDVQPWDPRSGRTPTLEQLRGMNRPVVGPMGAFS